MTAFTWTARAVAEAVGLEPVTWDHAYTGITTDTRTMRAGEVFVALAGERFDGHAFLSDARRAEVGAVVVRHGTARWPGFDWFEVDDTLDALGRLARYRRERFAGPVVAITGTNGKTSTKELTAAALAPLGAVHKSAKNFNNTVGVPLTVLAVPDDAAAMVVECGASLRGEIGRLRDIVRPDVAVVTNVDAGHVEGFGSLDAVLAEKTALLAGVPIAVVGTHPPALADAARGLATRVITAGLERADWSAAGLTLDDAGRATFRARGVEVTLGVAGRHQAGNAMLALAVADALGVAVESAASALAAARLPDGRADVRDIGGVTLINDSYNANPGSLRAALDLLAAVRGPRRAVVIVGTMRELGPDSARFHREAAEAVLAAGPSVIGAVGAFVDAFAALDTDEPDGGVVAGANPDDIAEALRERILPGDVVLLKASRGVALERLIPLLWPDDVTAEAP